MSRNNASRSLRRTSLKVEYLARRIGTAVTGIHRPYGLVSTCKVTDCPSPLRSFAVFGPEDLYYFTQEQDPNTYAFINDGQPHLYPTREAGIAFGGYLAEFGVLFGSVWYDAESGEIVTDTPQTDWVTRDALQHMIDVHRLDVTHPEALVPHFWDVPTDFLVGDRSQYPSESEYRMEVYEMKLTQEKARWESENRKTPSAWMRRVPHVYQTDFDLLITDNSARPLVVVEDTENPEHSQTARRTTDHIARTTSQEIMFVDMKGERNTTVTVVSPTVQTLRVAVPEHDFDTLTRFVRTWIIDRVFTDTEGRTVGYRASDGSFGVVPDTHAVHIPLSGSGIDALDIMLDAQHVAAPTQIGVGVAMSNH